MGSRDAPEEGCVADCVAIAALAQSSVLPTICCIFFLSTHRKHHTERSNLYLHAAVVATIFRCRPLAIHRQSTIRIRSIPPYLSVTVVSKFFRCVVQSQPTGKPPFRPEIFHLYIKIWIVRIYEIYLFVHRCQTRSDSTEWGDAPPCAVGGEAPCRCQVPSSPLGVIKAMKMVLWKNKV